MYKVLKAILKPIFFFLLNVKVINKEALNYEGGMILMANHVSGWDPILLHMAARCKVRYMAKAELFKFKPLGWLIKAFGAFGVERGRGDMGAMQQAFKIVREGGTLGIFPEGTRSKKGELGRFQHGASMIAMRAETRILPVYISRKARLFTRCYIVVGEPINLAERMGELSLADTSNVRAASEILRDEILKLKTQVPK